MAETIEQRCAYCNSAATRWCDGRRAPEEKDRRVSCRLPMCGAHSTSIGLADFCRDHRADHLGSIIKLRYGGLCRRCRRRLTKGARAKHIPAIHAIECLGCVEDRKRQNKFSFSEVA